MRFNTGCKKKLKKQAAQTKTTAHFRHRAGSEFFFSNFGIYGLVMRTNFESSVD